VATDNDNQHESVGAWAKRLYFANRAMIESVLRPYDLGSTQYYVLYQLANDGPTMQRVLAQTLHLEKATLSAVVASLVSKGLVDQVPDAADQRQRRLELTKVGAALWGELPDPIAVIRDISAGASSEADLATAVRVLEAATQRLDDHMAAPGKS
jgi:DNA-binding MarR family transcriptional regulator